ncbi:MAG: hypothetical protein KAR40_06025 [Candidatus Sabulitectum sp.]|nr:hypothetical protein [Candidatus Sabulitectum sp.]
MSYETGSASSMSDLMNKLQIFAVANGWTLDQYNVESGSSVDGKLSIHKGSVYVHFLWNANEANHIAMYQSLGYSGTGVSQWLHTDDSGNGVTTLPGGTGWSDTVSTHDGYRFISSIGVGPFTAYHFFQGNGTNEYIHVALEYAPFLYRNFGFGELEKAWDWTGGEYCYGHCQENSSPLIQEPLLSANGDDSDSDRLATIHVEGLPNQPAAGKWGIFIEKSETSLGSPFLDRAGENQVFFSGGSNGGPVGFLFNIVPGNSGDGFLPLTSNGIFYRDAVTAPDNLYFMGWQPDVKTLNMKNFSPGDEITVGSDTWMIFPYVRKQYTADLNESRNLGIAYKKIT